jgi:hypothetical protein
LPPKQGFVLTHFLTVADVNRSAEFYQRILGGTVVRSGEPTIIQIANSWLIVNVGGGPTDDKPNVTLRPPQNPNEVSSFLNIRVADIRACYEEWRSVEDYQAMRQDPAPLPFLQEALAIATFEPGMYEVVQTFAPLGEDA